MPDQNWLPLRQQAGGWPGSKWRPVSGSSFVSWNPHESSSGGRAILGFSPKWTKSPSAAKLARAVLDCQFHGPSTAQRGIAVTTQSVPIPSTKRRPGSDRFGSFSGGQKASQTQATNRAVESEIWEWKTSSQRVWIGTDRGNVGTGSRSNSAAIRRVRRVVFEAV